MFAGPFSGARGLTLYAASCFIFSQVALARAGRMFRLDRTAGRLCANGLTCEGNMKAQRGAVIPRQDLPVHRSRAITFQLAEVAVTGPMVRAILAAVRRLRAPPSCA
jgi:hypothetical protein